MKMDLESRNGIDGDNKLIISKLIISKKEIKKKIKLILELRNDGFYNQQYGGWNIPNFRPQNELISSFFYPCYFLTLQPAHLIIRGGIRMKAIVLGWMAVLMAVMSAYAGNGLFPADTLANQNFAYKETRAWRVHRACKISGWTAFGVGGSMMVVGFVGDALANWEEPSYSQNHTFRTIGYIGTGLTAASVPLFTFSVKNKKKAEDGALGIELDTSHWKLYRQFRTGAFAALGIGLGGMLAGWLGGAFDDFSYEKNTGQKASFYIGTALVAGSIPLFVLARRQKRAAQGALSLSMGSTVIHTLTPSGRVGSCPAWAFRVCF